MNLKKLHVRARVLPWGLITFGGLGHNRQQGADNYASVSHGALLLHIHIASLHAIIIFIISSRKWPSLGDPSVGPGHFHKSVNISAVDACQASNTYGISLCNLHSQYSITPKLDADARNPCWIPCSLQFSSTKCVSHNSCSEAEERYRTSNTHTAFD